MMFVDWLLKQPNSGGLSDEEIAANQLQVDSSLEAINRIAQSTTFQGRRLLDGSLDFTTSAGSVDSIQDISVTSANLAGGSIDVDVVVDSAATQATSTAASTGFTAAANATANTGTVGIATQTINGEDIEITGTADFTDITIVDDNTASNTGQASFDAASGTLTITANFTGDTGPPVVTADADAQVIQAAINDLDGFVATGATAAGTAAAATAATVTSGTGLTVTAAEAGSDFNNVSVNFVSGGANSAAFDADQNVLTVTVNDSAPQSAADIATAIETVQIDGAQAFNATGLADASFDINDGIDSIDTGTTGGEVLNDTLVFQLSGTDGAETFNFGANTSQDQIAAAVNLVSSSTGVEATVNDGALDFTSSAFGSNASVAIDIISEGGTGTFGSALSATTSTGTDIDASVNGIAATGNGNSLSINTSSLSLSLTLDSSGSNASFQITGGGATFQLGAQVGSTQQANLGIGSVSTGQLGGATGRLFELGSGQARSLSNDAEGAAQIVDEVISEITLTRGRTWCIPIHDP